ncbi:hypothetical protein VPH35_112397 [Triticum aestivum]
MKKICAAVVFFSFWCLDASSLLRQFCFVRLLENAVSKFCFLDIFADPIRQRKNKQIERYKFNKKHFLLKGYSICHLLYLPTTKTINTWFSFQSMHEISRPLRNGFSAARRLSIFMKLCKV